MFQKKPTSTEAESWPDLNYNHSLQAPSLIDIDFICIWKNFYFISDLLNEAC